MAGVIALTFLVMAVSAIVKIARGHRNLKEWMSMILSIWYPALLIIGDVAMWRKKRNILRGAGNRGRGTE